MSERPTDLDVLGEAADDAGDAGVEAQRLFDAALQVLHLDDVLRRARPPVVAVEDALHLVVQLLLLFGVQRDAVQEPRHGGRRRVVSLASPKLTKKKYKSYTPIPIQD